MVPRFCFMDGSFSEQLLGLQLTKQSTQYFVLSVIFVIRKHICEREFFQIVFEFFPDI